jgi:hypothetical protein
MAKVATVEIANADESDYIVINQSDYDPAVHTIWANQTDGVSGITQDLEIDSTSEPVTEAVDAISTRASELADTKTMADLKGIAKDLGIAGYSKMNQADITRAIAQAEQDDSDEL